MNSLGIEDKLVNGFTDLVVTCKYLIRNISFDFENQTIDHYSLFRTINEIRFLVNTDSSSNSPPLRISKLYALLWFYLRYIYENCCTEIFEAQHHLKALVISLIMDFWPTLYPRVNEFLFPIKLRLQFEKLIEGDSKQLSEIKKILGKYNFHIDCKLLGNPKNVRVLLNWFIFLIVDTRK